MHVQDASPEELARHGVCTIPEGRSVFPNLTVAENLAKIRDEDGYEVPANLNEEMGMTLKALS